MPKVRISKNKPYIENDDGSKEDLTLADHTERTIRHILTNYWRLKDYNDQNDSELFRLLAQDVEWSLTKLVIRDRQMLIHHFNDGYAFPDIAEIYSFNKADTAGLYVRKLTLLLSYYCETYRGWALLKEDF